MSDPQELVIRTALPGDAAIIARHRAAMFRDMGLVFGGEYELLRKASEPWLFDNLTNRQYVGWLVLDGPSVVAGAGVLIREQFPIPGCYKISRWAHVMNVYTEPEYRRRGLARRLMQTILEWCKAEAIDQVTLSASDEGRSLYEELGFKATSDMRLQQP